ncbi:MAG: hypothetical protein KIT84_06290 [Labilithrix sp.]|nr:hypothetical protein [Labilithrix sp.]MCW5810601.1 hypothetical protein [Labilithrix sp.]
MKAHVLSLGLVLLGCSLFGCTLLGCTRSTTAEPTKGESPQASAQPAPLGTATAPASGSPVALVEGGPPPAPMRGDEPLPADSLSKEGPGYTLSAVFRFLDLVGPQRAPEVNAAGIDAARRSTEPRMAIELGAARMRLVFSQGTVLPDETEVRSRADRYGHVLVWPGAATYRPLAPGALRALLGERRLDVAPITPADVVTKGEQGRRIGIRTRKVEVTTRAAKAEIEVGKLEGLAEGGVLLCRAVLDLLSAPPSTPLCALDELPVRAEMHWTGYGAFVFEVTASLQKKEMPVAPLLVPPQDATFATAPLPRGGVTPMLSAAELGALRSADVDVPPVPGATDALTVANSTFELRLLYLDGVAVAWAAPGARSEVRGLKRGKYVAQWRTFLGDSVEPPVAQTVPGIAQVGTPETAK